MIHFVHVGMPKAASTWLQETLFAEHPQLAVLGTLRAAGAEHDRFRQEVRRLVRGGDLSADVPAFRDAVERLADGLQARLRHAGRPAALRGLSSELFAGDWPTGRNTRFLAESLARCWPGVKVLLVLREQRSLLESSWREYVRQGGTEAFAAFLFGAPVSRGSVHDREPRRTHVVEYVKHEPKVALYEQLFGAGAVHVACMEQLRADPAGFVAGIATFLGVDAPAPSPERTNVQLSPAALAVLRRLNHLFATDHHQRYGWMPLSALLATAAGSRRMDGWGGPDGNPWLLRQRVSAHVQRLLAERWLPPLDRVLLRRLPARGRWFERLPPSLRAFLETEYARDNAALVARTGLPLSRYDYLGSAFADDRRRKDTA